MFTKTKIAICAAVVVCAASASFAKDQNAGRNGAEVARHSFGQAEIMRNPTRRPISGAEWWQNRGIADEMGYAYR
jgi:hypothetical protein